MNPIRIGVCALLAFAVLAFGGVENWARAALETGAAALFCYWAWRLFRGRQSSLAISPVLLPLAAFTALAFFQWTFHLTASRYATRLELQLVLALLLLLFLATQAFRSFNDWKAFVWFIMIFAFAVSIFGVLQHLTFNGKLYWFREMRYGGNPFGPYVNRNHYAGFAELTIPIALVPLILGKVRRERLLLIILFAAVPIGALLLSASRGGIISFGCQLLVLALWLALRRAARQQAFVGLAAVALALLMVSWLGAREVLQRFATTQASEVSSSKRASMARDTLRIFLDHPVVGTGLGTLQLVYPPYESLYDAKIVNHSHNDYLEALAETGALGGFFCAAFLFLLFATAYRRLIRAPLGRETAFQLAAFLGCLGLLVHSFVDFNLHIPANALLFFLMSALCVAQIPDNSASSAYRHRGERETVSALENPD